MWFKISLQSQGRKSKTLILFLKEANHTFLDIKRDLVNKVFSAYFVTRVVNFGLYIENCIRI